jgi:hypothetical protein
MYYRGPEADVEFSGTNFKTDSDDSQVSAPPPPPPPQSEAIILPPPEEAKGPDVTVRGSYVPDKAKLANPAADKPLLILVADDSQSNRKMMIRLLENRGHTCIDAVDGADALKKFKASVREELPFDLILIDDEMPVMDGPTAIRAMRSEGYEGVILGVTGNISAADKDRIRKAGADEVMEKPFNIDDFRMFMLLLV